MRTTIFLIISSFSLLSCNNGKNATERNFHMIPKMTERSNEVMPGTETFEAKDQATFASIKKLNQLMVPEGIIKLEATDDSIIGSIFDAALIDDHWFVLDTIQRKVFKFTKQGKFIGTIGKIGSGPGEYKQPNSIERCYDDNLAIYDSSQGRILVYDLDGNHQFTTNLQGESLSIHPRSAFVWDTEDRLYLLGFPSANPKAPWHALVNPHSETKTFDIVTGFGDRFEPYRDSGMAGWIFDSFSVVGDKIWVGPPYSNHVEVYDFEGRFVAKLGRNGSPNAPEAEDHQVKNLNQVRALRREKDFNVKMCTVGPIVLAFLTRYVDVYDHQGNLLTQPLKAGKISYPLTSYSENGEHFMVTPFYILEGKDDYTSEEQQQMLSAGYDFNTLENENTGLRISRFKL